MITSILTKARRFRWFLRNKKIRDLIHKRSNADVFAEIYRDNKWGAVLNEDGQRPYFSGSGSHDKSVVEEYVNTIGSWVASKSRPMVALDVGCGDFNIGSRISTFFDTYIAADVVSELIEHNKKEWAGLAVEFITLDIAHDTLPKVDVIFIREVLQHLSNQDIKRALSSVIRSCNYLVLTESLPDKEGFTPNLNKPSGIGTRSQFGSGVDITCPPFSVKFVEANCVISRKRGNRLLKTTIFKF